MSDLHPLIARLEAATGPDRELDGAIWAIADVDAFKRSCTFRGKMYGGHIHTPAEKREHTKRNAAMFSPKYTASLDAALTLLPEGCGLELRRYWRAAPGVWWSAVLFMSAAPVKRIGAEDAPTAALALLTAILKARAGGAANTNPPAGTGVREDER